VAVSINKNWLLLAAAIALGGIAFFLSNKAISSRMAQIEEEALRGRTMVKVVVPNRALKAGEVIDSSVVSVREVPSEFVNKSSIDPTAFESINGEALQVDVDRGEPILKNYTASRGGNLFSATLKEGRRALTIEVDDISSFSGMLRPGDRIDLMLTARSPAIAGSAVSSEAKDLTFPMMSNVEVIATGQAQKARPAAGEAAARSFTTVTLDVTPLEATRIIAAKTGGGKLTAVLRNAADKMVNVSGPQTINDVVAALYPNRDGDKPGMPRFVQYIVGGAGGAKVTDTPILNAVLKDPKNRAMAEKMASDLVNDVSTKPKLPSATLPTAPMPAAPSMPIVPGAVNPNSNKN
jgi:pilus assembly protein CpaB